MFVKLKGKTRHGKNRVSQHGEWWEVDETSHLRGKFRENASAEWKPAEPSKTQHLLWSVGCVCNTCKKFGQDWRWVEKVNDPNFDIIEKKENI